MKHKSEKNKKRNLIIKSLCVIELICLMVILKQIGLINMSANNTEKTLIEGQEGITLFAESDEGVIECDSIVQGIKNNDLSDGEYTLRVTGTDGEVIDYDIELYNFYEDTIYTTNQSLGSATADQRMLIVKYHGDLTINSGVTVTAAARKKGMYVCVLGELLNKGTITMTARGAIAEGENVYLWKRADGIFEYIPVIGGVGGTGASQSVGAKGADGISRATGGGGSGGSTGTNARPGGNGGSGTSYSGGSGGGGAYHTSATGSYPGGNGSSTGGAGGAGSARGASYTAYAAGGAGNNAGNAGYSSNTTTNLGNYANSYAQNGTGGLLILYANDLYNSGIISSDGSNVAGARYNTSVSRYAGGGASGAGSVNIFYGNNIIEGNITANGGTSTVNASGLSYTVLGGKGGDGSISINHVAPYLNYPEKEIQIDINTEYKIDSTKLEYIRQSEEYSGIIKLGKISYEILDEEIATINSSGKIVGIKEGKTKVKITDIDNSISTYIYLVVKNGVMPDVQAGNNFTVALKQNGTVWSFGANNYGQLGDSSNDNRNEPTQIMKDVAKIGVGNNHTIVLTSSGDLYTWGLNDKGQLGNGTNVNSNIPVKVDGLTNIIKVDSYKNMCIALDSSGRIYVWGEGYSNLPMRVIFSETVIDISGKLVLTTKGTVYNITDTSKSIEGISQVAKISSGNDHYLALLVDGTACSWGINNTNGKLGLSTSTGKVTNIANGIYDISAGLDTTILMNNNGEVFVAGANAKGQIGTTGTSVTNLVQIPELSNIEKVTAGENIHTAVLDEDGFIWLTGDNTNGQLGFGDNTARTKYTKLGETILTVESDRIYLDIGNSKLISGKLENTFNLKIDLIDDVQDNFIVTMEDTTKGSLSGKTVTALDYGLIKLTITHIETNKSKQIEVRVALIADSIVQGVRDRNLSDGEYYIYVQGEEYLIELYNHYDDITYTTNQSLGSTTADETMLVVKYHGNLVIEKNVVVTAATRKKGMYLCVLGDLTNKGTITMTARGAIAEGQDVYLWRNIDDTYEYVSAIGGQGGIGRANSATGISGNTGIDRATGGGGSGASAGTNPKKGGNGGNGTSYSGGSGGGGTYHTSQAGTYQGGDGSNIGGAGGAGAARANSSSSQTYAAGGAGNNAGNAAYMGSGGNAFGNVANSYAENGTGGLLIMYANTLYNEGTISSNGSNVNGKKYSSATRYSGGGASGGGSINIFANTVTRGNITANGGVSTINKSGLTYAYPGGKGADGSVTINELGSSLNYPEKEIQILVNEEYSIDEEKLSYIKFNDIQTEDLTIEGLKYETVNGDIADVSSTGTITGRKLGTTKVKITDTKNNISTYVFVKVIAKTAAKIELGESFTAALKQNGTVWTFGNNNYGQLGDGTNVNKNSPIQVVGIQNVVDIGAGNNHAIAVNDLGEVHTWGLNDKGQLGNGTTVNNNIPVKLSLSNIVKVDAYKNTSIALDSDGKIYAWGEGYGSTPTLVQTDKKIVEISGDIVLSEEGKVYYINNLAQEIEYIYNIVKISAGSKHYLMLSADGKIYAVRRRNKWRIRRWI